MYKPPKLLIGLILTNAFLMMQNPPSARSRLKHIKGWKEIIPLLAWASWVQIISDILEWWLNIISNHLEVSAAGLALTSAVSSWVHPNMDAIDDLIEISRVVQRDEANHKRFERVYHD